MSMRYVRDYYGVPAYRGGRVRLRVLALDGVTVAKTHYGTITSATRYLMVRIDGTRRSLPWHPLEADYLDAAGAVVRERRTPRDVDEFRALERSREEDEA